MLKLFALFTLCLPSIFGATVTFSSHTFTNMLVSGDTFTLTGLTANVTEATTIQPVSLWEYSLTKAPVLVDASTQINFLVTVTVDGTHYDIQTRLDVSQYASTGNTFIQLRFGPLEQFYLSAPSPSGVGGFVFGPPAAAHQGYFFRTPGNSAFYYPGPSGTFNSEAFYSTEIPEPSTAGLVLAGLAALLYVRRKH